jgi:hypothetical protein
MKFGDLFLIWVFRLQSSIADVSNHPHYVYQLLTRGIAFIQLLVPSSAHFMSTWSSVMEIKPVSHTGNGITNLPALILISASLFMH